MRYRGHAKRAQGFTLIELLVALTLLALMAAVLFGSLSLSGRTLEGGERKVAATTDMRMAQAFLRSQLEAQYPKRMRKIAEFPLLFAGERDEVRFAAPLPGRAAGGGIWFYRLAVAKDGERSRLVLERMIPDVNDTALPEFRDAERSVLLEDVAELRIGYFGRDPGSNDAVAPTWRDRWDDRQQLPLMVRIDVSPKQGDPWPTLLVAPRTTVDAGCRAWDRGGQRCAAA